MKTRITELLGIEYPIIQAGMTFVSYMPLVVAVSEAGGLGIMTCSDQTPDEVRDNIRRIRELTKKPFGVNLVPYTPGYKDFCKVILDEAVPVFSHGLGNPFRLLGVKKPAGMIFMPTVGNAKQAKMMEKEGADALVVHGFEGGGHVGYVATTVLVPKVAETVTIPIAAAGGFCDGRGLVAALALGAHGIAMGSRFCATQECPVHEDVKKSLTQAKEEQAIVSSRYDGLRLRSIPGKGLKNYHGWWSRPWEILPSVLSMKSAFKSSYKDLWEGSRELMRYKIPLIQFVCGCSNMRKTLAEGTVNDGIIPSGQVAGRLRDVPTCRELLQRIMVEAEEVAKSVAASF
jgi:enoyl-[acyl-carrier protein] reductase II